MSGNWTFEEQDRRIVEELKEFLPEQIFDGHAHIWRTADLTGAAGLFSEGPDEVTIDVWREYTERQVGKGRLTGGLFFGMPLSDINKANDFVIGQLTDRPESRGLVCISPDMTKERAKEYINDSSIAGFKPYHIFSREKPTFQSSVSGYLPQWAWELADEFGLVITLHLVRDRALADPDNRDEIIRMCRKYSNAKLVLAHAARGFHAPNTKEGIASLRGLENVWFDSSAVCEAGALCAVLREFGPGRLIWGSDFCVSEARGKCVTAGDGFVWLYYDSLDWKALSPACRPALVGLEALRALKDAADVECLGHEDIRNIFSGNAQRLLGLRKEPGDKTQKLYSHAKSVIPGGVQLLSKRPEMYAPGKWPAYFSEARGCEVWDLDGKHYTDMSTNGIGSCLLGYRDPDVTRAVQRRINAGAMSSLNPPEEVELADVLCDIHPWAEQVRFARTGGESMAVAVRIARATTGRPVIAVCGYSGWHDWYLAANLGDEDSLSGHLLPGLEPQGVPVELRGTARTFHYNNRKEFEAVINSCGDRLAAVVMEPARYTPPENGFLEYVRDEAHRNGALLLFDEISIGWRLTCGGAHLRFGVNPDIAVFAKALGNGHPMAAVIGTADAMSGAHTSFISSTYWTESVGPAAALATVQKMRKIDLPAHVSAIGNTVMEFWRKYADTYNLPVITGESYPCFAHFRFEHEFSGELRTLYTQLMLRRGFLAGTMIYPTLAHTEDVVTGYGAAIDEVFSEIADICEKDEIKKRLDGPAAHSGFSRLT